MQVGIIGSGAMGAGIAQVAASAGHLVVVFDQQTAALEKAKSQITQNLERLLLKNKITEQEVFSILQRITFTEKMSQFADCELVIEAIVEELELKKKVFQSLEQTVSEVCILATNTSSLSVTSIAAACRLPHRVLGIHFFNPAPLMELVEIIPALQTDNQIVEKVKQLILSWKKLPVIAKDTPGFLVNRIARPYYGEAIRILEEGVADCATIDWAMTHFGGFKMGPFLLMDFIGHDVNFRVTESIFAAFYFDPRYRPSFTQKRLLEAGWLGKKTGRGFYDYAADVTPPTPTQNEALGKLILERILIMLINEAADALFLGIATRADLETAMQKGTNYPKGLLAWADEIGVSKCVQLLDSQYDIYKEDRYRCSPLLRQMTKDGRTFF